MDGLSENVIKRAERITAAYFHKKKRVNRVDTKFPVTCYNVIMDSVSILLMAL